MVDLVLVEREEGVVTLSLNRPERKNALSRSLINALRAELLRQLAQPEEEMAAIIISGQGGNFSSGADLEDLNGTIEDIAVDNDMVELINVIQRVPVPVIAAIDGACIGAAVDLCLSCDLRVVSESAYFQVPATRLGLLYNPSAIRRIYGVAAHDTLVRLLVLGERFDAETALQTGLITYVAKSSESALFAQNIARAVAANDLQAVRATKTLLNTLADGSFEPEYWDQIRQNILNSKKRKIAVEAAKKSLREKRKR